MSKQTPISMYFRSISTSNLQSQKTTGKSSTVKRKLSLNKTTSKIPAKTKRKSSKQLHSKPMECVSLLTSSDDDTTSGNFKTNNILEIYIPNTTSNNSDTDEYSWTMDSNPATPRKVKSESPKEQSETMKEHSETLKEQSDTLKEQSETPKKQSKTPKKLLESPDEQSESPKKHYIWKYPRLSVTPNNLTQLHSNDPKTPKSVSHQDKSPKNGSIIISDSPRALLNKTSGNSPNKSNKYYSASKKRSVTKVSKSYTPPQSESLRTVRKLFRGTDKKIDIDFEQLELDDKTYFFIRIIKTFLDNESIHYLLSGNELDILKRFLDIKKKEAFMLICRLYWRKYRWYMEAECHKICETLTNELLNQLVVEKILLKESGSDEEMSLDDYLNDVLKSDDVKNICKSFKLLNKAKKSLPNLLRTFCSRTQTISQCFNTRRSDTASSGQGGNLKRVLKKMGEVAGTCYKLSTLCKDTLYKVILIAHLGINYEVIREKRLELLFIQVKNRQETFPTEHCEIDNVTCVFPSKLSLDTFMTAHILYEKFLSLSPTDSSGRKAIVLEAFFRYRSISKDVDLHVRSPWLKRYTAQNLYIKIIEEGIMELKKGKDTQSCESAALMMATLLQQASHRSHRRASWADEQAKIMHKYLQKPAKAAEILIEALESDIPDESKDILKSRARTIACQKNIKLEEDVRNRLLAKAQEGCMSEKELPHSNVYQQPMENVKKGKIEYKVRGINGYEVLRVENVAIDIYMTSGEFTEGHHWEGKMIITQFFLLFWDIIYARPKNSIGIFLCPYQMYPLDMYMSTFYSNRQQEIEERLQFLELEDINIILSQMEQVWIERPKGELSGVNTNFHWKHIYEVSLCMGAGGLAAVCGRLARDYQYTHSGFPDLTVWNVATKVIKFVEVKSDNDKPSMKQLQWMQYLLQNGLKTEFCYVGTK